MIVPGQFSIVIACYNYGHFLERAVDSALAQNDSNFEVIVVDDGSTDNTPDVAQGYGNRIIYHRQQNAGHCATNNKGVSLASGEWICFLDADDELLPDALENFRRAIMQHPGADLYFGGYMSVTEDGTVTVRHGSSIPPTPEEAFPAYIAKDVAGVKHGSVAVHRRVFDELQYPVGLRNNTDVVFLGQVIARFPAFGFQTPVLRSHAHSGRVRKNAAIVMSVGMSSVDVLFNPAVIPQTLMRWRYLYAERRSLSIARMLFRQGDYREAATLYNRAIASNPRLLMRPQVLKRWLLSLLKRVTVSNKA